MSVLAGICVVSLVVFGQRSPETMTNFAVRLQSPEVPVQSFGAKPKIMYRAGSFVSNTSSKYAESRGCLRVAPCCLTVSERVESPYRAFYPLPPMTVELENSFQETAQPRISCPH